MNVIILAINAMAQTAIIVFLVIIMAIKDFLKKVQMNV